MRAVATDGHRTADAAARLRLRLPGAGLPALDEGESVTVDVTVERGFIVSVIDVNGHFYRQPTVAMRLEGGGTTNLPSPSLVSGPGERTALVTRDATGLVMEVGEQSFRLDGPIRCE